MSDSGAQKWPRIADDVVGDFKVFQVSCVKARSPRNGKVVPFHVLDLPNWVVTIPVTPDGKLVMVEQFRAAADEVTLEFPSGRMEDGEEPMDAALRELEEETGYKGDSARALGTLQPDPGLFRNTMTIVLAEACEPTEEKSQDDGEDVHVRLVDPEDVPRLIENGDIRHVNVIAPWYLYEHDRRTNVSPGPAR
jgi:8-oxo-dGTP pyrophosphatase MutT (NUDIX family)